MKKITDIPNEYLEEMDCLSDAEFGRLIRGLLQYSITGVEPDLKGTERLFWKTVRNREDRFAEAYAQRCATQKENGKKGGRPKNPRVISENPKNPRVFPETQKTQQNRTEQNRTELNRTEQNRTELGDKGAHNAPTRHRYGEYENVLLTDDELGKLKNEFPDDWQERIERLSGYIASSGKKYKSHLATIRNWARKEKPTANNGSFIMGINPDELEGIF
nr:MAG TPA: hypothetical protein [Caudoviricetes sp.]